jgi:hypothetical protein
MIDELRPDETETGFGTGLRAHLGYASPAATELVTEVETHALVELEEPLREGEPQPVPEAIELDHREELLLALETELVEREQAIAAREAELRAQSQRLVEASAQDVRKRPVRELLQDLAQQQVESIVLSFQNALEATRPDGRPDFETRLAAARALLAEAYGDTHTDAATEASGLEDELARLRVRRGLA